MANKNERISPLSFKGRITKRFENTTRNIHTYIYISHTYEFIQDALKEKKRNICKIQLEKETEG